MKSLKRMLISSIVICLLCLVTLSTSTYAWFSMNKEVFVTGMEVRATVADNLFIADTTIGATAKNADTAFKNWLDYTSTGATLLEPVSTIDGKNFFYTDAANNVNADGTVVAANYTALNTGAADPTSTELEAFVTANGATGSVGYKDFVFELKAINGSNTAQNLNLTKADLVYKGAYTEEKAFRIAIFVQNLTHNVDNSYGTYTMVSSATLPTASTILTKASAAYNTASQAVSSTTGLANVAVSSQALTISVPAGKTEYYKVVVRIWLEGEDTTCNNQTFASLNQNWALDLKFELGTNTTAVTNFGAAGVAASANALVGTVTLTNGKLSNGETPATTNAYQWYNAVTGTAIDNATSNEYTATDNGQYFCKVTTVKGNVYYTNALSLSN